MSEQPTPETDKIAKSLLYENADKRDYELRQHARRLERERDAERAIADSLADALTNPATYVALEALTAWKEARSE